MSGGPEFSEVEQPFLDQLAAMGWKVVTGSVDHPSVTGRGSFREVLIRDDLEKALRRINLRSTAAEDGVPWLDDARVSQAIGALERISQPRLMEANQEATALLLNGIAVEGLPDWDQGRAKTIHFVDWDPRIPPIAITDASFGDQVGKQVGDRAKASEMEHAIRHHIKKKLDEDPVHYQKLSERLEEILNEFGNDWEQLTLALKDLVEEVKKGRKAEEGIVGLDPLIHAPFFDVLKEDRSRQTPVRQADVKWLADLTLDLVERVVRDAVSNVGFWKSAPRQEELRDKIFMFLDENEIVEFDRADALADRLMELAKANGERLVRR